MYVRSYDDFLTIIGDEEREFFEKWAKGRFTVDEMRSMDFFTFNAKVLIHLDKDPYYKRMKPYYELCSRIKKGLPNAESTLKDRKGRWWGCIFRIDDYRYSDRCGHCGLPFYIYDRYYDICGNAFCQTCFKSASMLMPTITHHYPNFVERDDVEVYPWKDLATFLKDHPPKEGWHYEYSDWHIMDVKDDQSEWWVLWNIQHPKVLKDVMNGLKMWSPPHDGE